MGLRALFKNHSSVLLVAETNFYRRFIQASVATGQTMFDRQITKLILQTRFDPDQSAENLQ